LPVNITDANGNTALHISVSQSDLETSKTLCKLGAKADLKNNDGLSPIDTAESLRNSEMRNLLKRHK
jgi:ankyrin repeat protein